MLTFIQATMWLAILLALCCLTSDSQGAYSPGKRRVIRTHLSVAVWTILYVGEALGTWPASLATFPGHSWRPGKDPGQGALDPGNSYFQLVNIRDRESNFCSVLN